MKSLPLVLCLLSGCAHFAQVTKDCTIEACKEQAPHLLPVIADLFIKGATDIVGALASEGIHVAIADVDCIAHALFDASSSQLAGLKSGTFKAGPGTLPYSPEEMKKLNDATDSWAKRRAAGL